MSPAPRSRHQIVASNLGHAFQVFVRRRKLGLVLFAPLDVYLPGESTPVEPDIVIVSQEQMDIIVDRGIEGAPALLVEILSPSTRWNDLEIKRPLYAECGVAEFWIVDAEAGEILVHAQPGGDKESGGLTQTGTVAAADGQTNASGNWKIVGRYIAGQRARSLVLKGFSVAVDAVMAGGGAG
jgi:Uma2 family endonuclease